jgi:hypothetical protein
MCNCHALANLERLRLRDSASTNTIKNYINKTKLISPQMKTTINQQKKLIPKYYQNSYYKKEIHILLAILIIILKQQLNFYNPSNFVFSGRGEDLFQARNSYQPTYPKGYYKGKKDCGLHETVYYNKQVTNIFSQKKTLIISQHT